MGAKLSLTFRKEQILRVLENKVMRECLGRRTRKKHESRVIKSVSIQWAGHVAVIVRCRGAYVYIILVRKSVKDCIPRHR
jgi:hypothetical protein